MVIIADECARDDSPCLKRDATTFAGPEVATYNLRYRRINDRNIVLPRGVVARATPRIPRAIAAR